MFELIVAEDDAELRQLFCRVLTRHYFQPIGAADGVEALQVLERDSYRPHRLGHHDAAAGRLCAGARPARQRQYHPRADDHGARRLPGHAVRLSGRGGRLSGQAHQRQRARATSLPCCRARADGRGPASDAWHNDIRIRLVLRSDGRRDRPAAEEFCCYTSSSPRRASPLSGSSWTTSGASTPTRTPARWTCTSTGCATASGEQDFEIITVRGIGYKAERKHEEG